MTDSTIQLTNFEQYLASDFNLKRKDAVQLADELSECGIYTMEEFEEHFEFATENPKAEAEFMEYLYTEVLCHDFPPFLVIDWQATWDRNHRYDFFNPIVIDGTTYFIRNY